MNKQFKRLFILGLIACLSVSSSMVVFAGEWKEDETGWWYEEDDKTYPKNQWKEINGKQYYFDGNGYMLHDTTTPDNYTVGADGAWIDNTEEKSIVPDEVFLELNMTFGEFKQKYGEEYRGVAPSKFGVAYGFEKSPLFYISKRQNTGIDFLDYEKAVNYYFKETYDEVNDNMKVAAIGIGPEQAFVGFKDTYSTDEFVSILKSMGATNIRVLDKRIYQKHYKIDGSVETKSMHPTNVGFEYKGVWFYECVHFDGVITLQGIVAYPTIQKDMEYYFDEYYYSKPVHEKKFGGWNVGA